MFKDCQIERRTKILRQGVRTYANQQLSCTLEAFVLQQGMNMIDASDASDDVLFVLGIGKIHAGFSVPLSNLIQAYFRKSLIKK